MRQAADEPYVYYNYISYIDLSYMIEKKKKQFI